MVTLVCGRSGMIAKSSHPLTRLSMVPVTIEKSLWTVMKIPSKREKSIILCCILLTSLVRWCRGFGDALSPIMVFPGGKNESPYAAY